MAYTTRTEEYVGITELLDRFDGEAEYDDIVEVLRKYYPDPDDDTGIDASLAENNPEFTIELDKSDERCDFYCVEHYIVKMPNREAANELAEAIDLDATIIEDNSTGTTGSKTFRITYRNEIYIKADSEEEARKIFEIMDKAVMDSRSELVEISSVEEQ